MRIQHNIAAINSHRQLMGNNTAVGKNLEKLSSGYRINRAGDDAAGLAISEKMRAQITGLETAQKNANDGISLIQTAEGALTEVHSMLNRMVELADQSANGTYQDEVDRENLQKEMTSLKSEIDRISKATNFNGINLLDGSLGKTTGAPSTMVGVGSKLGTSDAVVTAANGAKIGKDQNVTISAGTYAVANAKSGPTVNQVIVEVQNDNGKKESFVIDLAQAVTSNGKSIGDTGTMAVGDTATIDLSKAGLGTIEITVTKDGLKASELATDLTTAISGKGPEEAPDDAAGGGLRLQIGDTSDDYNQMKVNVGNMSSDSLGIGDISVATQDGAADAVKKIKDAINTVSSTRGDLGALQNRLEHTINNLGVTTENMTAAESRIRDVDMAKEMMSYTKNNILVQASQAMLAQANQQPQGVLQLLQ